MGGGDRSLIPSTQPAVAPPGGTLSDLAGGGDADPNYVPPTTKSKKETERQREAAEFRALGNERAQEIRARADREVTVLVAEANSKSEQIRGDGDAERNSIFAAAFNRDRDFFAFYRTIQAYQKGFTAEDTRMLLKPNTEFFQYFGSQAGRPESDPAPK